ncbi:MAG: hypothetical protein IJD42_02795 [Clostridia bacterium]|nr:hypothetical protein [Clostridia bacterium]
MEENKNTEKEEKIDTPQPEFESNAARRLRLMGVENDDKIHDTAAEITKGNFFANLWYKHKWAIIITTIFLLIGIVLLCTYIFRDKPDMRVSYCGPTKIGEIEHENLTKALVGAMSDYNGDGKIEVMITSSTYRTAEEKREQAKIDAQYANKEFDETMPYSDDDVTEVSNSLRLSKYNFVLIDKDLYDKMVNSFTPLYEILGDDVNKYKHLLYEDCGIYLKKTEFAKNFSEELFFLPDDTIIVICKPAVFDKKLENEYELLKAILSFEKLDEEAE